MEAVSLHYFFTLAIVFNSIRPVFSQKPVSKGIPASVWQLPNYRFIAGGIKL